jgi:hypothetical protein
LILDINALRFSELMMSPRCSRGDLDLLTAIGIDLSGLHKKLCRLGRLNNMVTAHRRRSVGELFGSSAAGTIRTSDSRAFRHV